MVLEEEYHLIFVKVIYATVYGLARAIGLKHTKKKLLLSLILRKGAQSNLAITNSLLWYFAQC